MFQLKVKITVVSYSVPLYNNNKKKSLPKMEDKLMRALYRVSSRGTLYQLKQSFSVLGFFNENFLN